MDKVIKKNTIYLRLTFLILILVLVFQLFRIQVLEHNKWKVRSEVRNEFKKTIYGARGKIYFSDGTPLAINELAYGIYVLTDGFETKAAKDKDITKESFIEETSKFIQFNKDQSLKNITNPNLKYVSLAHKVTPDQLKQLTEKYPLNLNIWTYEEETKRVYPNNQLAAKIVGFVRKDDHGKDIGQYGLEEYFNGVLTGTEGVILGNKDSTNQIILDEKFESIKPKDGIDLTLTIDRSIQLMLEERLMYWLDQYKAKEATAVIMEPNTGRIIAIANLPTYNPNEYWKGEITDCSFEYYSAIHEDCNKPAEPIPCSENPNQANCITSTPTPQSEVFYPEGYEERLKEIEEERKKLLEEAEALRKSQEEKQGDPKLLNYPAAWRDILRKKDLPADQVFRNAANSYVYEPGSAVKVITLAIAYNYNKVPRSPNYQLGGHQGFDQVIDVKLHTASKEPVASLSVEEMLRNSDNVGALRVAQKVPIKDFTETLSKFGLGKETGVELADESVFRPKNFNEWTKVDQSTAAYGQGSVAYTPIQLTHAWNIMASGGKSYKPTLIKSRNDNGEVVITEPQFVEQVISEDAARDALAVNAIATSQSSRRAKELYAKYPFTGKTSTANIPNPTNTGYLKDVVNTSYLGSAPLENPKFTMLVWFREPRKGVDTFYPNGTNTAQAAWVDIADRLMVKMNVPPVNQ